MKDKPTHFIVMYDDGDMIQMNYGWERDCFGALCGNESPVAIFTSRRDAARAIAISTAFAKLCARQGLPVNDDFTTGRKNIKIAPCSPTHPTK